MPVHIGAESKRVILTEQDIASWEAAIDELNAEIAAKKAEIAQFRSKLEAARIIMGDGRKAAGNAPRTPAFTVRPMPMTRLVLDLFDERPGARLLPMAVTNLLTLSSDELAARVKENPDNIYTVMSRLKKRGLLIQHADGTYQRAPETSEGRQ